MIVMSDDDDDNCDCECDECDDDDDDGDELIMISRQATNNAEIDDCEDDGRQRMTNLPQDQHG